MLVSSSLLRKKGSPLKCVPSQNIRAERPERKYQLPWGQQQLPNPCLFIYSFILQRFTEHPLCAEHYIECLGGIRHGTLPLPFPQPHTYPPTHVSYVRQRRGSERINSLSRGRWPQSRAKSNEPLVQVQLVRAGVSSCSEIALYGDKKSGMEQKPLP